MNMKTNNVEVRRVSVNSMLGGWVKKEINRYENAEIPEILYEMDQGRLTRAQLTAVITIRYQVAHFFEDMLCRMLQVIEKGTYREGRLELDPEVKRAFRKAVEINLQEERGEIARYGGPHEEGRKVFLTALGIDYEKWKEPFGTYESLGSLHESAQGLISKLRWVIDKGAVEALSVLWYYECRIALGRCYGDYHFLLRAFEEKFPGFKKPAGTYCEGDALWHLHSHAVHDELHAELAMRALIMLEEYPGPWFDSIELGFREALFAFERFWGGLFEEILGRRHSTEHYGETLNCMAR